MQNTQNQNQNLSKQALRNKIKKQLLQVPHAQKLNSGRKIAVHLEHYFKSLKNPALKNLHVGLFKSFEDEVITEPIGEMLKNLNIPYSYPTWGNSEMSFENGTVPNIILTPGLCFDNNYNRLGRGGGYFDRYFKKHGAQSSEKIIAIGLCLDFQIVPKVPIEAHDKKVDKICSPNLGLF